MTDDSEDDAADASVDGGADPQALADRVADGDLRLYELDDHADAETAATARRLVVERDTGVDLSATGDYAFAAESADSNIENLVGGAQLPVGVAGPVEVHGEAADGDFYLPIATTEGALVASVNRGCSAISAAGGATVRVTKRGMTRAPVFRVDGVAEGAEVAEWVEDNEDRLAEAAEGTTSHGRLQSVTPYVVGDSVFLRFSYDTGDANGMNMATIATRAAAEVVEDETPASLVALSGNLCTDKKPAAINAVEGRGHTVTADVTIPRAVVEERFGTTPEAIEEANTRKNLIGSAKAGSLGFNAQAANVVAGVFIATGQDEAHVVEGSNCITTVEAREEELYASVNLASLQVGTVGGGTDLATQSELLDVIGFAGGGDPVGSNADGLAEVIAAGALAGELSLVSALASRHLSSAHEELGR
ncbi:3-hydroxy-3-methylglutaryl-CoA reductase [Halosimplex carlsbadense 2-9-1]|uniref:3-hydroxy-3-methylglutaryl coenzyme A reductase n=1 Tax=Halosimplex carlsbadense 2-9-1 TaxID=797114 RepID=M0D216_9EURY|nr:hydroxymethylglutaryl-CoA reductase (NADPH) [Halosimplex carlsbadense]ELZ28204.1 3-hydroxy-3-methylglutaryl-CoA reductase [Halosimplex carlsbadense 2-9-1]